MTTIAAIRPLHVEVANPAIEPPEDKSVVAIVGMPNVGKSVMFNNITGTYVTVSNYPGTTVEISQGRARIEGKDMTVLDTPGMYSLLPVTDEEQVARQILLDSKPYVVIHMVDAKNLERMLPLSLQLLELDLNVVLVLNMMDEAKRLGIRIDVAGLSKHLGIPVIEAVATSKSGLSQINKAILEEHTSPESAMCAPRYDEDIEAALAEIGFLLPRRFERIARATALLLLQQDAKISNLVRVEDKMLAARIDYIVQQVVKGSAQQLRFRVAMTRQDQCRLLIEQYVRYPRSVRQGLAARLSDITINPITGIPILCAIIYFGLYKFVGVFGAGTVVNLLEKKLFGESINPWFNGLIQQLLPGKTGWAYWTRELFGSEYGLVTLGVTYAIAIVLPIVSLFFLFFSILEDSGYFPRLALLVDRLFKKIGLNGRAVIPLVLGFGCDTMATMVTRIQETKRERVITTLLLALVIPCSAQYGVITALLSKRTAGVFGISYAWLAWAAIMTVLFVVVGRLASRIVKGEAASFYMELPPLRLPRIGNVVVKTLARMKWYFLEILPFFLFASVLIWVGRLTGIFDVLIASLKPVVMLIGLPAGAAPAFLYGFFRRDFGAAGLFQLADSGQMNGGQLLVACVTLTLFLPCVAQFLIMKKERGLKSTLLMSAGIVCTAFLVGGAVNMIIKTMGVAL